MDTNNKKEYAIMENILNKVNKMFISLPEDEKKRNTKMQDYVTELIISKMKEQDIMFNAMYERKFYGGSYYDNLKVGKPEEYDLDMVLNLPVVIKPEIACSDRHGFVHLKVNEYQKLIQREEFPKYKLLNTLLEENFLSTFKVLAWIEGIIAKVLNNFPQDQNRAVFTIKLDDNQTVKLYGKLIKQHPAFTLNLTGTLADGTKIFMDTDLVPCFQFIDDNWPKGNYRKNTSKDKRKFMIVPKKPHKSVCNNLKNVDIYWRLSFQEQERELMKGDYKGMKQTIRLLKKLRDKHNHPIASYFIKTIFLWELEDKKSVLYVNISLSCVFMTMLQRYADMMDKKCIPYYWNKSFNLVGHMQEKTLEQIANTLKRIVKTIEANLSTNPRTVVNFLLTPEEQKQLGEVDIGIKNTKKCLLSAVSGNQLAQVAELSQNSQKQSPEIDSISDLMKIMLEIKNDNKKILAEVKNLTETVKDLQCEIRELKSGNSLLKNKIENENNHAGGSILDIELFEFDRGFINLPANIPH